MWSSPSGGDEFGTNLKTGSYRATGLGQAFERANTLLVTEFSDYAVYPDTGDRGVRGRPRAAGEPAASLRST